ncbi:hypothetical protein [Mycolicibacterium vaccae]|uniref:hypothetical protein n=1 Tax=Mycolicibacterium vaccae TaxID=1810 RepID=UPI003D070D3E
MSETTPPPQQPEPVTTPIYTPPAPQPPVNVEQQPGRLNKVAAWVGIVAGIVFIVAVIFGAGVFVGKNVDDGPRHHRGGPPPMNHHGQPMPPMGPMGPGGGFNRGQSPEPPRQQPATPESPAPAAPARP